MLLNSSEPDEQLLDNLTLQSLLNRREMTDSSRLVKAEITDIARSPKTR